MINFFSFFPLFVDPNIVKVFKIFTAEFLRNTLNNNKKMTG